MHHRINVGAIATSTCGCATLVWGTGLLPMTRAQIGYTFRARVFPSVGRTPDQGAGAATANGQNADAQ